LADDNREESFSDEVMEKICIRPFDVCRKKLNVVVEESSFFVDYSPHQFSIDHKKSQLRNNIHSAHSAIEKMTLKSIKNNSYE
jgi:hypothetical protein